MASPLPRPTGARHSSLCKESLMPRRTIAAALLIAFCVVVGLRTAGAAAKFNRKVEIGQKAPEWKELKGTDDKMHSLADLKQAKLVVVTFTCNHCPVAGF